VIKKLQGIKNKRIYSYLLTRRRDDLLKTRRQKTRSLLIEKQKQEIEIENQKREELNRQRINRGFRDRPRCTGGMISMLMFRSAVVEPNDLFKLFDNIDSVDLIHKDDSSKENNKEDIDLVKATVKHNINDIINVRHTEKKINKALLPEIVYNSDSKIQISKSELTRIIKFENKLRISDTSKKRNDYFSGCRQMSEIDQDYIEEALLFYYYTPSEDDSLKAYHLACGKYIDDLEMKENVVWMKYDKMRKSSLTLGQSPIVDSINVYSLDNKVIHLKDLILDNKPNLIICGSFS